MEGMSRAKFFFIPAFFAAAVFMSGCRPGYVAPRAGLSAREAAGVIAIGADTGMAFIPEGEFIMGADEGEGPASAPPGGVRVVPVISMPRRSVYLKAFYMDRYEVPVRRYREFMAATGRPAPHLWGPEYADEYPPVRDNDPISDVSWHDAESYCRWAGKRLPTEEEWEKAARGTDGRRFPWGNEWKDGATNSREYYKQRHDGVKFIHTVTEIGSLGGDVSPYGVYDMAGNVMEWTSSWFSLYPGSALERRPFDENLKIMRGGSWMGQAFSDSFTFSRYSGTPGGDDPHYGFRCARDGNKD